MAKPVLPSAPEKGTVFYKMHTGVCAHYCVQVEHLKKPCQIRFCLIRPDEAIYVVTIPQHQLLVEVIWVDQCINQE